MTPEDIARANQVLQSNGLPPVGGSDAFKRQHESNNLIAGAKNVIDRGVDIFTGGNVHRAVAEQSKQTQPGQIEQPAAAPQKVEADMSLSQPLPQPVAPQGPMFPSVGPDRTGGVQRISDQIAKTNQATQKDLGGLRDQINEAGDKAAKAEEENLQIIAQQQKLGQQQAEQQVAADLGYQTKQAEIAKQRADYSARMTSEIAKDVDELRTMKVEPRSFWASQGTAATIAGVLGAMFSGFSAGMNGGTNGAIALMDRAIERDIEAQRQNIAGAKENISVRRAAMADGLAKYGDLEAAELAQKAKSYASIAASIEPQLGKLKSQEAINNAKAALAHAQQESAKFQADFVTRMDQINSQSLSAQLGAQSTVMQGKLQQDQQRFAIGMERAKAGMDAESQRAALEPNAQIGGAQFDRKLSDSERKEAREATGDYKELSTAVNRFLELRKEAGGGKVIPGDMKDKLNQAGAEIDQYVRKMIGGKINEDSGTKALLDKLKGFEEGSDLGNDPTEAAQNLLDSMTAKTNARLSTYGGRLLGTGAPGISKGFKP